MKNTYYLLAEILLHFPPDFEITAIVSDSCLVLELIKKKHFNSFIQSYPIRELQKANESILIESFIRSAKQHFKLEE